MANYDDIASKLIKYSELAKEQFIKKINELFSKPEFQSLIENISTSEQDIKLPFKRRASENIETKEEKKEPKKEPKKEIKKEPKKEQKKDDKKDTKTQKESKKVLNTKEIKKPRKTKENKESKKEKPQKDLKKEKSKSKDIKPSNKQKENKEQKNLFEEDIKKKDKKAKNKTNIVTKRKKSSSDSDIFSGTDTESEIGNFVKSGSEKLSNVEFSSESEGVVVSESENENEKEYNPDVFITNMHKAKEGSIKQTDYWKMQEEEIKEVFSSDSHSLFSSSPSSDTMDNNDLDILISKLKSSPDLRKQVLIDITKIVDSYSLLDQSTKDKYKPLLLSLESIKFSSEDSQSKVLLYEISAKIKKVTHI